VFESGDDSIFATGRPDVYLPFSPPLLHMSYIRNLPSTSVPALCERDMALYTVQCTVTTVLQYTVYTVHCTHMHRSNHLATMWVPRSCCTVRDITPRALKLVTINIKLICKHYFV